MKSTVSTGTTRLANSYNSRPATNENKRGQGWVYMRTAIALFISPSTKYTPKHYYLLLLATMTRTAKANPIRKTRKTRKCIHKRISEIKTMLHSAITWEEAIYYQDNGIGSFMRRSLMDPGGFCEMRNPMPCEC